MKNLFTFIVALFMATGVYAQEAQFYKSFEGTTVQLPTQTEVQKAIDEGWASVGKVTDKNFPSKTGNVDPETDKIKSKYTTSGIALKHGNGDKTLTLYVKDIRYLKAYAVTTSSADTRVIKVTATPTEGDPVEASSSSKPGVSAVVSLILNPDKDYKVLFEGYKSDMSDGADLALQGVRFIPSTSTATSVAIGKAGFATLAPSFAVDYSNRGDGLEAYYVSYNSSSNELTYTKIDGVVEAGKAVILKGMVIIYWRLAQKQLLLQRQVWRLLMVQRKVQQTFTAWLIRIVLQVSIRLHLLFKFLKTRHIWRLMHQPQLSITQSVLEETLPVFRQSSRIA